MTKPPETPTQVGETAASEPERLVDQKAPPLPPLQRKATFQMISMKSPAVLAAETRVQKPIAAVQMRSLAEVGRPAAPPPGGLGFLAPPRGPAADSKGMRVGLYVALMVLGALGLAAVIATAMWFLAYR